MANGLLFKTFVSNKISDQNLPACSTYYYNREGDKNQAKTKQIHYSTLFRTLKRIQNKMRYQSKICVFIRYPDKCLNAFVDMTQLQTLNVNV